MNSDHTNGRQDPPNADHETPDPDSGTLDLDDVTLDSRDDGSAEDDPVAAPGVASPSSERYVLSGPIGEGGMAVVHLARDTQLERTVAIKCLRRELVGQARARERFFDEAHIMAGLDHPGSVPVYETGRLPDGQVFYAMKRVRGRTLKELFDARTPEELRSRHSMMHFVDIFERVCQTVAAAHEQDIIHRDLKPENIMVDELGGVYVMDWGLAKKLPRGDSGSDSQRTRMGAVMGTPAYMSPEQAAGQAHDSDCQTDVFSLGVMLYEILTGTNPFAGADARQSMKGVMYHDPDDPRRRNRLAGRALAAVCMKAIDKDPMRRYPTARELAADIRAFREFRPVSAVRLRPIDRLYNWSRRRPVSASVLATLLLVVVVATLAFAVEATFENHLVAEAYELMDEDSAEIARLGSEVAELEDRLLRTEDLNQRYELGERLAELEARRDHRRQALVSMATAIIGFTVFSPDSRAQQIVREDVFDRVTAHLEAGDYARAEVVAVDALRVSEGRNVVGYSAEEQLWLRQRLTEAQGALATREERLRTLASEPPSAAQQ